MKRWNSPLEKKAQRQRSHDGSSRKFDGTTEYRVKITDSCGLKLNQMIQVVQCLRSKGYGSRWRKRVQSCVTAILVSQGMLRCATEPLADNLRKP